RSFFRSFLRSFFGSGFGVTISPVHRIGSNSWFGRKLTASRLPLSGARKTRHVSRDFPGPNFCGNDSDGHLRNVVVKRAAGSSVFVASTPHSGTPAPPTCPFPT